MTMGALRLALGRLATAAAVAAAIQPVAAADERAHALYTEHCAECHGAGRLGGIGPALLPENLGRLKRDEAAKVIAEGRISTQMPAFGDTLAPEDVKRLTALVFTPLPQMPVWGPEEMVASRIVHQELADLPAKPQFDADPFNLFTVVEAGDHHVTVLDGDRFEPLARFPSRYALHGGAKYSPDGRFVYFGSRDGWVSKYDLWSLSMVAEVRAGINTRNIAVSHDGRTIAVANYLPTSLAILDSATLLPIKVLDVASAKGERSRVSAVYTAPPRDSFVFALKDIPEIWEISYAANPKPMPQGLVHNDRPGQEEGTFDRGPFPVRRIVLDEPLDDFFFDPRYAHVMGAARGGQAAQVVNLNVGRKIAELAIPGLPHLGSGITFEHGGRTVLATPHLGVGAISVVDLATWTPVKRIETLGPGFFLRGHEASPYVWADVFFGPHKDALHVIDTRTLEIVKTLRPEPGKTAAHIEFTRDGRYALASIWEQDGALVVYDAATFEEVKRIPMAKPVGKYNVYNKITYSAGTSH